ncbi:MAG TPA: sulfur carrier protein ThiS [Syntrophorhabdales bacterium]|nr:sulfur carrier protein ThiS [Syntrophorhabdales bacterium]
MVLVEGREFRWREGLTVAELLEELGDPYPYAVVRVNDAVVSGPDFERAKVPRGSEVFLIPLIAGG